jgi:pilus assembly protein CpaE
MGPGLARGAPRTLRVYPSPVQLPVAGEALQVPTSSILLFSSTVEAAAAIADVLRAVGHTVTLVSEPDAAVRLAAEVDLLVIDAADGEQSAAEICSEIRRTPALARVAVLCVSQHDDVEERVRFLEAGADDVLARPFDPRELEARAEGLLIRLRQSRGLGAVPRGEAAAVRRRLIALCSPKGGVGTTTIAVNVATFLAARMPGEVALLDLDMDFGQVATHLNVKARLTLADLAQDESAMAEPELLRSYAERADPGLHVIAAPPNPELGRLVTPAHVERILNTALIAFQVLVVDAGSSFDERVMAMLDRAEAVVVPITPEVGALKAFHAFLEFLTEQGAVPGRSTFVLNHIFARDMLSMRQIETAIAARVALELPYDPGLYLKAVNEGVPVVRSMPSSAPGKALARLAIMVAGIAEDAPAGERRKSSLLAGLRRR